jgi:copper chaperone NosL
MITRILLMLTVALALTLGGCGDSVDPDEPPEIRYGVDVCTHCGMIISEEAYAAGLVSSDGETAIFDDIGEMIDVVQDEGVNERRVWVKDFESLEWLDGIRSFYVLSDTLITPMGSGVVAFADRPDAEAFADEHAGTVMTWEEILTELTYRPGRH